jgi:hypothetical protein
MPATGIMTVAKTGGGPGQAIRAACILGRAWIAARPQITPIIKNMCRQ